MWQFQLLGPADGDGGTEHTTAFAQHEIHLLGCNHLCGGDEVAFVLAVFVIYHNDKLAFLKVLQGGRDG